MPCLWEASSHGSLETICRGQRGSQKHRGYHHHGTRSKGVCTVMLGLRPRLRVVREVKTAMSVAGKGHCKLKPRMSRRSSVPLAVQIWPGKRHQSVYTLPPSLALRAFQSLHTLAEPTQQLHKHSREQLRTGADDVLHDLSISSAS